MLCSHAHFETVVRSFARFENIVRFAGWNDANGRLARATFCGALSATCQCPPLLPSTFSSGNNEHEAIRQQKLVLLSEVGARNAHPR